MKPISSVTTTMQKGPRSKIGTQDGGRGLETRESSEVAAWLSKQIPADMDKAAQSRALSHGVRLNVAMEGRFPRGPNGERLPMYLVATGCDVAGTRAQRDAAIADLQNFMTKPEVRSVETWIAELSVLTAGRGREGFDAELMVSAYASRLAAYPADVVRYALLGKTWKWFPTWDELEKVCEAKTAPRRHMLAAIAQPIPDDEPKRREPTQDERDRIQSLVDEMFPTYPKNMREAAVSEALKGKCMKGGAA